MDNIWDRKSFEVGDHWPLWQGWNNRMTTQNQQTSNAKKHTNKTLIYVFLLLIYTSMYQETLTSCPFFSRLLPRITYDKLFIVYISTVTNLKMINCLWLSTLRNDLITCSILNRRDSSSECPELEWMMDIGNFLSISFNLRSRSLAWRCIDTSNHTRGHVKWFT